MAYIFRLLQTAEKVALEGVAVRLVKGKPCEQVGRLWRRRRIGAAAAVLAVISLTGRPYLGIVVYSSLNASIL